MNTIKDRFTALDANLNVLERGELKLDNRPFVVFGSGAFFPMTERFTFFCEFDYYYHLTTGAAYEVDGDPVPDDDIEVDYYSLDFHVGLNYWLAGRE